jgi:group II intron reverse transcriptase/maturase
VSVKDSVSQFEKPETIAQGSGQKLQEYAIGESTTPATTEHSTPDLRNLIEAVIANENLVKALKRVESNKGAAGIDNRDVTVLRLYLKEQWPQIKEELLNGTFKPSPVKRVEIPKPGGGIRKLGIPTVLDRFIQQALHQILSPIFEREFSEHSFGFRPKRSAHDAVKSAQKHAAAGNRIVIDLDLDSFFDRVNHDILMSRVARKVKDKRILILIRRFLQSGVMAEGVKIATESGTPQGGPLSPLLSNILLNDFDKELERRGHKFCRYADDVNIYVKSKRAGERVLSSVTKYLERTLKLKVNKTKSAVARPWERKFLGYSMTWHKKPRLKVASQSLARFGLKLRDLFRKGRGRNIGRFIKEDLNPLLRGWANYFHLIEVKGVLEELDMRIRHHLRCVLWRQWKKRSTRFKRLVSLGISTERARDSAPNGRGPWWNSGASHMNDALRKKYFDKLGLISLLDQVRQVDALI